MKFTTRPYALAFLLASAVLLLLSAANAQSTPSASDQQRTPGAAYQDGFNHGNADAQKSLPSYGQPGDLWTTDETRSAYTLGYGAGYAQGRSNAGYFGDDVSSSATAGSSASGGDAGNIGYADGRAAGGRDLDAGNAFRPADGEMYKKADHGWTPTLGNKDQYQQAYREAYARGYQEGYGNSPTAY